MLIVSLLATGGIHQIRSLELERCPQQCKNRKPEIWCGVNRKPTITISVGTYLCQSGLKVWDDPPIVNDVCIDADPYQDTRSYSRCYSFRGISLHGAGLQCFCLVICLHKLRPPWYHTKPYCNLRKMCAFIHTYQYTFPYFEPSGNK